MKAFYQSKVFWFNILAGVIAIAGIFGFAEFAPSSDVLEIIAVVVSAINIILRFITKEPIGWK
jgi:uncharacterized membrane protein